MNPYMFAFNEYIFLIISLILIALEFVIPGGILGILGGVFYIASFFIAFGRENSQITSEMVFVAIALVSLFTVIKTILWKIKNSKKENSLYLATDQEGYKAVETSNKLLGKIGKAESNLRPSGYVIIDGENFQALSLTGYIEEGTLVIVEREEGSTIFVRQHHSSSQI